MANATLFSNCGGPEVLEFCAINDSLPGEDQVLIRHTAIGVNYLDIIWRLGAYGAIGQPSIPGFEAVGIVEKSGDKVSAYRPGDKVVYATAPMGAYCTHRVLDQKYLIKAPSGIDDEVLAATFFKGLAAHYMLFRAFSINEQMKIVVHSAAGGLGQILTAWAKSMGVEVFGTVGDDAKRAAALEAGCSEVFNRKSEPWADKILSAAAPLGVNAVYDGVGKDTIMGSLKCLRRFGLLLSIGQSSGAPPSINLQQLQSKSLFVTAPSIFTYKANRTELVLSAEEVFAVIKKGIITPKIGGKYKLENAQQAHRDLQSGLTKGSLVLIP